MTTQSSIIGLTLGKSSQTDPSLQFVSDPAGVKTTTVGEGAVIRSHTVLYFGNKIGNHFSTGHHVTVREENNIGDDVSVGTGSIIEHHVTIGNRVRMHSGVFVPEYSVLEDDCWLGPRVTLTNATYPQGVDVKKKLVGPRIGVGAKIGANATLLPGVQIGKFALVGAGSVVTKDVPDYAVVVGNPARVINDVRKLKDYEGLVPHE